MNLLLVLCLSITTISNQESELGYWVCDKIKQEMNADLVILPEKIFTDTLLFSNDRLVNMNIDFPGLKTILSDNLSANKFLPISGFRVIFDTLENFQIITNKLKEKYLLVTTISLVKKYTSNFTILKNNIIDIIISQFAKSKYIIQPEMNRYIIPVQTAPAKLTITSTAPATQYININAASKEELEKLPGIGPILAQKIIDYRKNISLFQSKEDIMKVSGIGEKKFEQIKALITF